MKYTIPHTRLGSSSFLAPHSYVPGTRFAADFCEDIALLLIEIGDNGEELITEKEVHEIAKILDGEGISLHVHLPTKPSFDSYKSTQAFVRACHLAIERSSPLNPHTFVLHVDFPSLHRAEYKRSQEQKEWTAEGLRNIAALLPSPEYLALENLETYSPAFLDYWLADTAYSRCFDIGHMWKDGRNPASIIEAWLPKIRLFHLHGLHGIAPPDVRQCADLAAHLIRDADWYHYETWLKLYGICPKDHTSLAFMAPSCIDLVMHPIWDYNFTGVINLEMFSVEKFTTSYAMLMQSRARYEQALNNRQQISK